MVYQHRVSCVDSVNGSENGVGKEVETGNCVLKIGVVSRIEGEWRVEGRGASLNRVVVVKEIFESLSSVSWNQRHLPCRSQA